MGWQRFGRSNGMDVTAKLRGDHAKRRCRSRTCRFHLTEDIREKLSRLRRVEWLRLPSDAAAQDLEWISQLTQLHGLSLNRAKLQGADFSCFEHFDALQLLDLSWGHMSATDFETLPRLDGLRWLLLDDRCITDQYVTHLAELALPSLERLSLEHTYVSDAGLARLCATYDDLTYLNLYNSELITGKSLYSIGRMKRLRFLGIGGTGLSSEYTRTPEVQQLEQLLPECRIDFGDSPERVNGPSDFHRVFLVHQEPGK